MLRRNECRLNFKNRPVRTGDLKGGPKQPPLATNRGSQEPATNRVKSLLTWPMASPDTGVKCVTCSLPDSATTATYSSAAMSPPRPVLVWSRRPSKYSALSSPPLCCGSRVAAVFCLTRYRSLQTFFGSTNSCVLSCKTWDRCPIGNRWWQPPPHG